MSTATETLDQARPRAISLRWIINAREDLIWFIGSVASSYALLILYLTGMLPLIPMVAGWAILIDAPHVFGTLSRTYFDASEWKTRKRLLLGSLLFFVVGPTLVLLGFGFTFFSSRRCGLIIIWSSSTTASWCSTRKRTTISRRSITHWIVGC